MCSKPLAPSTSQTIFRALPRPRSSASRRRSGPHSSMVYRYVTEGSFDAYMWQTLETKAKFIAQVMSGDTTIRRLEDLDSAALT